MSLIIVSFLERIVFVLQIRSDKENFTTILYSLRGPGADEPPIRVFGVDQRTGFLKAYKILDREEIAFYDVRSLRLTF